MYQVGGLTIHTGIISSVTLFLSTSLMDYMPKTKTLKEISEMTESCYWQCGLVILIEDCTIKEMKI